MRITLKETLHGISMDSDNKYMKLMMITSLFLKTHQTQRLSETSQYTSLGDGMVSIVGNQQDINTIGLGCLTLANNHSHDSLTLQYLC